MQTPANKDIRLFIMKSFSDSELETFCFDYFPEVENNFTDGMEKNDKVMQLVKHCRNRQMMANLLGNLQQERPQPYQTTFSLQETIAATPPPPPKIKPRNPKQIFISHATATADAAELANKLAADLRADGHPVWIAPESVMPGEKWGVAIQRGLEESGIFVLLLTPAAVKSHWVKLEMQSAMLLQGRGQMRILPLDVQPCDVPLFWETYHFLDFQDAYGDGWSRLQQELAGNSPLPVVNNSPSPAEPNPDQCTATTKSGSRCRNMALANSSYCGVHTNKPKVMPPSQPPVETPFVKQPAPDENSFIHEKTGLEFVRIPAGEFIYSHVEQQVMVEKKRFLREPLIEYESGHADGKSALPEFWMSKTPVTNAVYKRFVTDWTCDAGKENHPVVEVNWHEAVVFCEWAGLELPTEEQWEKAARGTDGRAYPWGYNAPTDVLCNFDYNVERATAVGKYSPQGDSPYDCVDMSGNVFEWCLNKYDTPEDISIDKSTDWRVLRGGSWSDNQNDVRVAYRNCYDDPAIRNPNYGFRVVVRRSPSQ